MESLGSARPANWWTKADFDHFKAAGEALAAQYDAYRISLGGKPDAVKDGLAPAQYRAAAVRNLDAWYEAFSVQPPQKLYLAPNDRVRVW